LALHQAAQGNFTPLAESALFYRQQLVATGSNGLYLSITCAEDLPWIKPGEGERLSANTFLGDYRLRQQREACALWPRATIPKDYAEPTKADAPVLILTGEWDPVTPPANGDATASHLPNSLHVVVPHGAHGLGGLRGSDCLCVYNHVRGAGRPKFRHVLREEHKEMRSPYPAAASLIHQTVDEVSTTCGSGGPFVALPSPDKSGLDQRN
jgi:hypothetical protein